MPSPSILDGWWIEGCIEGLTGWSIGSRGEDWLEQSGDSSDDTPSLYDKLERVIIPFITTTVIDSSTSCDTA